MSVAKVLRLDDYRDRRQQRLELTQAFHQVDRSRRDILRHLADIAAISGADRVAAVWVDEYGPGLVHPYVVLDLLADTPRRGFPIDPLQRAWEIGVPGAHDENAGPRGTGSSTFAIALGSDGARAWFVVADSVAARPPLDGQVRSGLMFRAGECSAVALHRDLDTSRRTGVPGAEGRFAGWPILKDLEGREDEEVEARRIAQRFVVARIVRMLVDDDLVMSDERLTELAQGARGELTQERDLDPGEKALWAKVLDAFERRGWDELAATLVDVGVLAEDRGHVHGASELYTLGYHISAATGMASTAVNAARFSGRAHRRRAQWEEAMTWYMVAWDLAVAAGIDNLAALAMSGLATVRRERGNVPAARELLAEGLQLAESCGHAETIVTLHRDIVALEQSAGDIDAALRHGWLAVGASTSERDRTRSLATLAGALGKAGDYDLAADAWSVVAATSAELYLQVFALDALSHLCALRGDGSGFETFAARCDALDYSTVPSACAQVLHYRGLSYRALGRFGEAEEWLSRAVAYAEEHRFNETLFRAEEDLRGLATYVAESVEPEPAAPPVIREGVRAMRQELVGAGF